MPAPLQGPYLPPRLRPARALWRGSPPQSGFAAVPAPRQPPYLPPRRTLARAVVGFPQEGKLPVFVPVPAPQQLPTFPRRRLARAVVQFTPVPGSNQVPVMEKVTRENTPDDKGMIKKLWLWFGD